MSRRHDQHEGIALLFCLLLMLLLLLQATDTCCDCAGSVLDHDDIRHTTAVGDDLMDGRTDGRTVGVRWPGLGWDLMRCAASETRLQNVIRSSVCQTQEKAPSETPGDTKVLVMQLPAGLVLGLGLGSEPARLESVTSGRRIVPSSDSSEQRPLVEMLSIAPNTSMSSPRRVRGRETGTQRSALDERHVEQLTPSQPG